ncbi:hypothetical protein LZ554_008533 [Drepanopeziza brunnea f. sp. 'monogermtubi']|nr:hypothetical protein LZ554_008533 [Drepanopeziza brunnea f. sp. 'monogermtubi']
MSNSMSKDDAARIQSTQAKSGADMSSAGFAARAQGAGDRAANNASTTSNTGSGGGKGGGNNQGAGAGAQGGDAKK